MNKRLLLVFFFLSSIASYATHIVGGSITYSLISGTNYRITLKLYRDCGTGAAAMPNASDVNIKIRGYNGLSIGLDGDMTTRSISTVPSNLDSCAIAPSPIPCVQEGIFTRTVSLPSRPGGYHIYWYEYARNTGIDNVNTACNCIGESFYAYVPGPDVLYYENFTYANGTTVGSGAPAKWTRTLGATPPNYARVENNIYEVSGANNAQATLTTQTINIAAYPGGVNLSVDISESGSMDNNDSILVYYRINGGALILFTTNGFRNDDFGSATSTSVVTGNTLEIVVRTRYDGSSPTSELYRVDNIWVSPVIYPINNDPVFNNFPPLFLCTGRAFTFDHSAADANGDSLNYSFYTPYNGDDDACGACVYLPTFTNNVASFTPVVWSGTYSATNPLGGTPLTLNSSTGLLSGTPPTTGQFVVGIKVKEYRSGVFLSETLRDFQFNVVVCPPPAQASISLTPLTVCRGTPLTFPNLSDTSSGVPTWNWDFGFPGAGDVSTVKYPVYTYTVSGTYTARLITNQGTSCADTAYATVNVFEPAAMTVTIAPNPAAICFGQLGVGLTASATGGALPYSYSWNNGFTTSTSVANSVGTYSITVTGGCNVGTASVSVTQFNAAIVADAGPDQNVCSTSPAVTLAGSVTETGTGTWTGGTDAGFVPNRNTLNAVYTPSAAEIVAGSVTLTLTPTNNRGCPITANTMTIFIAPPPTASNAGPDQTLCNTTTATLAGNAPAAGTGTWTLISGTATITTPSSRTSTVTGLVIGSTATLRWTITSGACAPSFDEVDIIILSSPTVAAAGPDQNLCNVTTATLAGNAPAVGTGAWTVFAGTATITTPASPTSGVTGLTIGSSVTLRWTISNSVCPPSTDDVVITVAALPTVAAAGPDQSLCNVTTATLAGNAPAVGTG
ncbi:MAG: PKD domain-containing protein, partial [Bacteroidota bacterium]